MSKTSQCAPTAIDRLIALPALMEFTSLSKATIYRKIGDGTFPRPRKIGKSRVAWLQSDIAKWISERAPTTGPDMDALPGSQGENRAA